MERKNIKEIIVKDEIALGLVVNIPNPAIAELAGLAGFDFLRLDGGHFIFTPDVIADFVRAADSVGLPVIVRTTDIHAATILLDFGVAGIMVPHVRSAAQAQEIVDLYKYQPVGYRGMCGATRAQKYGKLSLDEYFSKANDETVIVIQIEDKEGIANMEEILGVEGLDLICTGRSDIAQALGLGGQRNHPDVIAMENRILECAKKAGLGYQLTALTMEEAQNFTGIGTRALTIGVDLQLLMSGMQELVETRRTLL
jgi:4-hydroxy-2-oxoheptanedioate aldolase